VDGGPASAGELPRSWSFEARGIREFNLANSARPWNWFELDQREAETMWRVLGDFVAYLNRRYIERQEQTIPPCWAEHGALVEELTTMFWMRWHAFETEESTTGGAQYWHTYVFPGFLERMARWIGPDRLHKCQAGKHETREVVEPAGAEEWEARTAAIAALDLEMRRPVQPGRKEPAPAPPAGDGGGAGPLRGSAPTLRVVEEKEHE